MDDLAGSRQQDRGGPSKKKFEKLTALFAIYNAHSLLSIGNMRCDYNKYT